MLGATRVPKGGDWSSRERHPPESIPLRSPSQARIGWFPGGHLAQLGERTLARFATLARSYPQGC